MNIRASRLHVMYSLRQDLFAYAAGTHSEAHHSTSARHARSKDAVTRAAPHAAGAPGPAGCRAIVLPGACRSAAACSMAAFNSAPMRIARPEA